MLAALGSTAIAQSTTETEETQTEERADGLSTGVDAPPEVGKTYVLSIHGDWELRCIKAPEGQKDPCQLYQLLRDQNDNSVAEINLFNLPNDEKLAAGATIVTPLETLLTRNVVMSVDGAKAKVYPFTFCTAIGCFARVGFTNEDINSFKRGNAAKIVVIPAQAPTQKVELTVSLKGFTAGFDAVSAAAKP
jgi:invasion protein IalB